jgi:hypothetical protein
LPFRTILLQVAQTSGSWPALAAGLVAVVVVLVVDM